MDNNFCVDTLLMLFLENTFSFIVSTLGDLLFHWLIFFLYSLTGSITPLIFLGAEKRCGYPGTVIKLCVGYSEKNFLSKNHIYIHKKEVAA